MTDKVQKIREEVARMHNLLPIMDGDNISINYADRICRTLEMYIDSLQEEPVSRTPADIEAAMQEVEGKSMAFTEAHQGEDTDTILAQMRGEEPVSEDFEEASIIHSEIVRNTSFIDEDFIAGAVWQKEQLMKDAIPAELYSDGMFTPLIGVKDKEKLKGIKFGDKVKLIIIKNE